MLFKAIENEHTKHLKMLCSYSGRYAGNKKPPETNIPELYKSLKCWDARKMLGNCESEVYMVKNSFQNTGNL